MTIAPLGNSSRTTFKAIFTLSMGASLLVLSAGNAYAVDLASHKAIYNIRMVAAKSGSQVVDVRGQMLYMFRKSCDGWISNHQFDISYEYAGAEPTDVLSKFTSFESFDGRALSFSSNRITNGENDQRLRGQASLSSGDKDGEAVYSLPEPITYKLSPTTLFPAAHTTRLIERAGAGDKIITANIFEGSDESGPVDVNAVVVKAIAAGDKQKIDSVLLKPKGWVMRMAVFPLESESETPSVSDYEMTMDLLENGVIRHMDVDYHDFSVSQDLVAIEPLRNDKCGME